MAYELKRARRVIEEIKLGDETLYVNLDVDSVTREFLKRQAAIIGAEADLRKLNKDGADPAALSAAMETYGNGVIALLQLVFGEAGAQIILAFYEGNYIELSTEVFPFIRDVVMPQIQACAAEQRAKIAAGYKQKAVPRKFKLL